MTAHEFIEQLFERPQTNVSSNMRYITGPQMDLLRTLIGKDEEGAPLSPGMNGGFIWMPRGGVKYVVSQNPDGTRRSLMKLKSAPSGAGRLFS